ncbi:MAG: hypothetical protein Q7J43_15520 [Pseudomonas sp.]|uniref:hypothetical protein n=1 Tax=Pseudomonas sp. TaxID=306 RepID=UPI002728CAF0|nr:hypothetical protein [Pseudomonas sp.]MDO9619074.1 hypothetical protein [Pseudomonas sp.]
MKANLKYIAFLFIFTASSTLIAQNYVIPPTSSTRNHVPVISDEKMEQCVKLYNESVWLSEKIAGTQVDSYSQQSVGNYNGMVNKHSEMTSKFNAECAGKQSRSACEAARKLNIEQGLPYQDC